MTLTLLHTAELHRSTFDTLRDRIAPGVSLLHVVRPDWLAEARANGPEAVRAPVAEAIRKAGGRVLCSCTTLGALAEDYGALRIDRPMMRAAATIGGEAVLVYTLASTAEASLSLLENEGGTARMLDLTALWPLFEAGETAAFHAAIAQALRADLAQNGGSVVVLAQASMAGATDLLGDLGLPVLSSPETALRAALA
ncbi:hypothetical protein ACRARG_12935 [Pseudooceanicola sp. C21-150M6]|uniref:hypothetical protein n=1 Tax=Pseudooceanicola sp. C21-150M6 TaxID=3434355 RepID=UPI003D7F5F72